MTAESAIINALLQEMPMRLAYPVVAEINRQIAAQQGPREAENMNGTSYD